MSITLWFQAVIFRHRSRCCCLLLLVVVVVVVAVARGVVVVLVAELTICGGILSVAK